MNATLAQKTEHNLGTDEELAVVQDLLGAAAAAGIQASRTAVVNIYVSLKTRPFLILAGERQTGKIALLKCLGGLLSETPALQWQFFVGHARWAAYSQDVSRFVEMQAQFNRHRLLALMEDAVRPENRDRFFAACLVRISPAELYDYFVLPEFQFWPDQARIEGAKPSAPIPYPPNFSLIGTMDTSRFDWWEADLLSRTTVVDWPGERLEGRTNDGWQTPGSHHQFSFLQARIRSEKTAYSRLQRALAGQQQAFLPLLQVRDLVYQQNIPSSHQVMGWVIRYLANSWTEAGAGLFDPGPLNNLRKALDLALAQYILPWIVSALPEPTSFLDRLSEMFGSQFNIASTFAAASLCDRQRATRQIAYSPLGTST